MKLCFSNETVFSYNVRSYLWFTVKDLKEYHSFNSRINFFLCLFFSQFLRSPNTTYCYLPTCVSYFINVLTTSVIHINMFIHHHLQVKRDICEDRMKFE